MSFSEVKTHNIVQIITLMPRTLITNSFLFN